MTLFRSQSHIVTRTHRSLWRMLLAATLLTALPVFLWAVATQRIELRKKAATNGIICWNQVGQSKDLLSDSISFFWPDGCKGNPDPQNCSLATVPLTSPEIVGYQQWVNQGSLIIPNCSKTLPPSTAIHPGPEGCRYVSVQCIQAPCDPILVCDTSTICGPNGSACNLSCPECPPGKFCPMMACRRISGICKNNICVEKLTPTPICVPRPACMDQTPPCMMYENVNYCPPRTPTQTPTPPPGCRYQQPLQCIQGSSCDPILVCNTPTPCNPNGSACTITSCPGECPTGKVCPAMPCRIINGKCVNNQCVALPTPTSTPIACGGITGIHCPFGMICQYPDPMYPDAMGYCVPETTKNPKYTPTPTPKCIQMPPCTNAGVGPNGSIAYCDFQPAPGVTYCPPHTPTQTPTPPPGCWYQQVQCIQAPCNPILVCDTPTTCGPNGSACSVSSCLGCPMGRLCPMMPCRRIPGICKNNQCVAQTTAKKPGDLNDDGAVDIFDYNIMIGDFGKTGTPGFIKADLEPDGVINIFDYNLLLKYFGS